ncbi:MAG: geranylgeranylglycerol-phosphate geranylgeranyltransferase [Candidatus Krumholzibacteria bacterium]|nr:geranylgeranylglycerol-phosphate geranylgeranyltransferase [Candidatus Krumholzibacteria bacterium]
MRAITGILTIMRLHNVAAAVFCVATGYWIVSWPEIPPFAVLAAVALATAAGNVINDYNDIGIDRINKPGRALPSGRLAPRAALYLYIVLLLLLIVTFPFFSFQISVWIFVWIILLFLYSRFFKRMFLAGNLLVSVVTGSGFVLGALVAGRAASGLIPAVYTFLFVLGRELVKDCEDLEGDRRFGARTVPVVCGQAAALNSAAVIFVILAVSLPIPWLKGFYSAAYMSIMAFSVLPILIISIIFALQKRKSGLVSNLLKLGMFFGILAFLAGSVQ